MPQPFNYMLNLPDPTQGVMGGVQNAVSIANMMAQRNKAEQDAIKAQQANEQHAAMQLDLGALSENPTAAGMTSTIIKYPQLAEHFKETYSALNAQQKDARVREASGVYAALQSGSPDIAQKLLAEQAAAFENSGNEQDAKVRRDLAELVKLNPSSALTSTGLFLASAMGPEKFADTFTKLEEERRKKELQPGELQKQGIDMGLTKEQTAKAILDGKKVSAETTKILMEIEAAKKNGGLDPEKAFQQEDKLRTEYTNLTASTRDVQSAYQRVLASEDTPAGDIALIFNYMKMLDPGSVVREGEFATAQNAGSVSDRVYNTYNKLLSGERLNPEQRKMFGTQSKKMYVASQKQEEEIRGGMTRIAKNYGLNPENIFYSPQGLNTPEAPAGSSGTVVPPVAGVSDTTQALLAKYGTKQ